MAAPIKFESSWEKQKYREICRKEREKILDEAKAEYEKKERKKERARQQGEGTWMLPSISSRVEIEEQMHTEAVSGKRKKKHKKEKKSKKKSKHKEKCHDESSESSSEEEAVWKVKTDADASGPVESTECKSKKIGPVLERDSWMTSSSDRDLFAGLNLAEQRRSAKAEARLAAENAMEEMRSRLELNPYWKNGGSGLPTESSADHNPPPPKTSFSVAHDGGLSWWRKAYQRCTELAAAEGRSLEEVAAERYGSLEELQRKLDQAEAAEKGSKLSDRDKNRRSFRRPGSDDVRTEKARGRDDRRMQFRRPDDDHNDERDKHREQSQRHSHNSSRDDRVKSDKERPEKRAQFQRPDSSDDERNDSRHTERTSDRDRQQQQQRAAPAWRRKDSISDNQRSDGRSSRNDKCDVNDEMKLHRKVGDHSPVKSSRPSSSVHSSGKEVKRRSSSTDSSNSSVDDDEGKTSGSCSASIKKSDKSASSSGESSAAKSTRDESRPVARRLTEQEMNQLGAKILKAELMGNESLARELKAQLTAARAANAEPRPSTADVSKADEDEVVVLTRTDSRGMVRPLPERSHPIEPTRGRRKKQKVSTHGKKGERERYFDDDDGTSLKSLVEREKLGTAEDQNRMFARLAGRGIDRTDDDYQLDDALLTKAAMKQSQSHIESRERQLAIYEHKKMASSLEKCQFCFSNIPKHLIIAIGLKVCLVVPNHRSMTEGHCLIVPMHHVTQSTVVDEDVWDEIKIFRKGLTRLFADRGEDCVFMETAMNLKRLPHMVIECVPMSRELGDMAPIYFKKAIQECESEWSDNKKLVDLSKKDIRRAVPKGFAYFSVDFGLQGGYAHVIEDEKSFPSYFGREVVGGMLDLDPSLWRRPFRERFDEQRKKVLAFAEWWKPYDWTQRLQRDSSRGGSNDSSSSSESDSEKPAVETETIEANNEPQKQDSVDESVDADVGTSTQ